MSKLQTRYIGVYGDKAIELPFDFDFSGSGILPPPIIIVNVDRKRLGLPPIEGRLYVEVEFVLVDSQEQAARAFGVDQQTISRWLKRGAAAPTTSPDKEQKEK